ncbi:MAG: hypothetical protein M3Z64_05730 [Verrucomicrobiota bacterium]|nr:hypothetical protein [Verrucomicrobiota bacterium]
MSLAIEVVQVSRTAFLWQQYDASAKADLFSTALLLAGATYLIDPIALAPTALEHALRGRTITGILVTNSNHVRSAAKFAKEYGAPIFVDPELLLAPARHDLNTWPVEAAAGLTIIRLPGAPAGEIAIHHSEDGGELIIGDALINFDPYGFTFLPDKYCQDPLQMRESLRGLLELQFERILFAHGLPIMSRGRECVELLLESIA